MKKIFYLTGILFIILLTGCGDGAADTDREQNKVNMWVEADDYYHSGGFEIVDEENEKTLGWNETITANDPEQAAKSEVTLEEAGRYRVWIRLKPGETGEGALQIQINDNRSQPLAVVQDPEDEDYTWIEAGAFKFDEGKNEIAVNNYMNFSGKVSKILITSDLQNVPEEVKKEIPEQKLRELMHGGQAINRGL